MDVNDQNSEDEDSLDDLDLDCLSRKCDDAFRIFDQTGKLSVDVNEVGHLLRYLRINLSQHQIRDFVAQFDLQPDNRVKVEELKPRVISCIQDESTKPITEAKLQIAFRTLEEAYENLTKDQLERCLTTKGEPLSEAELSDMFNHLAVKKNGAVDWAAYIRDIMYTINK